MIAANNFPAFAPDHHPTPPQSRQTALGIYGKETKKEVANRSKGENSEERGAHHEFLIRCDPPVAVPELAKNSKKEAFKDVWVMLELTVTLRKVQKTRRRRAPRRRKKNRTARDPYGEPRYDDHDLARRNRGSDSESEDDSIDSRRSRSTRGSDSDDDGYGFRKGRSGRRGRSKSRDRKTPKKGKGLLDSPTRRDPTTGRKKRRRPFGRNRDLDNERRDPADSDDGSTDEERDQSEDDYTASADKLKGSDNFTEMSCGWIKVRLTDMIKQNGVKKFPVKFGNPWGSEEGSELPEEDHKVIKASKGILNNNVLVPLGIRTNKPSISVRLSKPDKGANWFFDELNLQLASKLPADQMATAFAKLPRNMIVPVGGNGRASAMMIATYCHALRECQAEREGEAMQWDPVLSTLPDMLNDPAFATALYTSWNKQFYAGMTEFSSQFSLLGKGSYVEPAVVGYPEPKRADIKADKYAISRKSDGKVAHNLPKKAPPRHNGQNIMKFLQPQLRSLVLRAWPVYQHHMSLTYTERSMGGDKYGEYERQYVGQFDGIREDVRENYDDHLQRVGRILDKIEVTDAPRHASAEVDVDNEVEYKWTNRSHVAGPGKWKETLTEAANHDDAEADGSTRETVELFSPFNVRELSFQIDDALGYITAPKSTFKEKKLVTVQMTAEQAQALRTGKPLAEPGSDDE